MSNGFKVCAPYTNIPNYFLRRTDIKRDTSRLLIEMMSHSDDWVFSINGLVACGYEGRGAVRRMVSELEELGLLHRFRMRDDSGQLGEASWVFGWAPMTRKAAEEVAFKRSQSNVGFSNVGGVPTKKEKEKEITNERTSPRTHERQPLDEWLIEQFGNLDVTIGPGQAANVCGQVFSTMLDRRVDNPRAHAQQYLAERVLDLGLRDTPPDQRGIARFLTRDAWSWEPQTRPGDSPPEDDLATITTNGWTEEI